MQYFKESVRSSLFGWLRWIPSILYQIWQMALWLKPKCQVIFMKSNLSFIRLFCMEQIFEKNVLCVLCQQVENACFYKAGRGNTTRPCNFAWRTNQAQWRHSNFLKLVVKRTLPIHLKEEMKTYLLCMQA